MKEAFKTYVEKNNMRFLLVTLMNQCFKQNIQNPRFVEATEGFDDDEKLALKEENERLKKEIADLKSALQRTETFNEASPLPETPKEVLTTSEDLGQLKTEEQQIRGDIAEDMNVDQPMDVSVEEEACEEFRLESSSSSFVNEGTSSTRRHEHEATTSKDLIEHENAEQHDHSDIDPDIDQPDYDSSDYEEAFFGFAEDSSDC